MRLNNRVYDILKWIVITALPAVSVLLTALLPLYGCPDKISYIILGTISAVTVFLGTLLGVSSERYKKEGDTNEL